MKQVILKQLNMEKYKRRELEEQPDTSDQEPSQDGGNDQLLGLEFSDSLYDDAEQEIQSIWKAEDIKEYNFDTTGLVTLKAARMSKEAKAPFAIIKNGNKKKKASEFDSIYAMSKKIKYSEYKQGIRLGFIRSADSFEYDTCDVYNEKQIAGVVNDRFPIHILPICACCGGITRCPSSSPSSVCLRDAAWRRETRTPAAIRATCPSRSRGRPLRNAGRIL